MLSFLIGRINYGIIAVFGITLSASFSAVDQQPGSRRKIVLFCLFSLAVQLTFVSSFGTQITTMLYPLLVHLPLIIFFAK